MTRSLHLKSILKGALLTATCLLAMASCNQATEQTDTATEEKKTSPLAHLTHDNIDADLAAYAKENPDSIAVIGTRHGEIKVRLFKDVPLHRANFVRLAKTGFYDQGEFTV